MFTVLWLLQKIKNNRTQSKLFLFLKHNQNETGWYLAQAVFAVEVSNKLKPAGRTLHLSQSVVSPVALSIHAVQQYVTWTTYYILVFLANYLLLCAPDNSDKAT